MRYLVIVSLLFALWISENQQESDNPNYIMENKSMTVMDEDANSWVIYY